MLRFRTPNGEVADARGWAASEDGAFLEATVASSDFEAQVRISRPFRALNEREYTLLYLSTANFHESAVVDLVDRDSDERFGLIIPIQAIASSAHSRAEDEYFESVASALLPLIADDVEGHSKLVDWRADEPYLLSDFFPESLAVMAVRSDRALEYPPERYLPSLFSQGYCVFKNEDVCAFISGFVHSARKTVRVSGISDSYFSNGYIVNLYRDVLPFERSDLAFFVLLYQIFETLMQHVFEEGLDSYKTKVSCFNGSASDLRELSTLLSDVTSERDRIRVCVERSRFKQSDVPDLTQKLVDFLSAASKAPRSTAFSDLLYDVRNLIFHSHRAIPPTSTSMVSEINAGLAIVMPKILTLKPVRAST